MSDTADLQRALVRYFHDCLAAQSEWGRSLNILDQSDISVLPLSKSEQRELGVEGSIKLGDAQAIELGKKAMAGGKDFGLQLGALFLIGRLPPTADRSERRVFGPILEVAVNLRHDADGKVVLTPDEVEFAVNYGMLAELLEGDEDALQDRLEDLAELVPDFPIDENEFDDFWRGFRLIAPELKIDHRLPPRRKPQPDDRFEQSDEHNAHSKADLDDSEPSQSRPDSEDAAGAEARLELIDFFLPKIPSEGFRMLPATAILLGPKAGRSMSALAELRRMQQQPLEGTAFAGLFDPSRDRKPVYKQSKRDFPDEVLPIPLTPAQTAIVESARSAPLTVVTGPPGTGKSHTITAIALDALLNNQTMLIASQMDKAVEVVADRLEALVDKTVVARSGGRAAQRQLAAKIKTLTGPRNRRSNQSGESLRQGGQYHYDLTLKLQKLEQEFHSIITAEREWSCARVELERVDPSQWSSLPVLDEASLRRLDQNLAFLRNMEANAAPGWIQRWKRFWTMRRVRGQLQLPSEKDVSIDDLERMRDLVRLCQTMRTVEQNLMSRASIHSVCKETFETERKRRGAGLELLRQTRSRALRKLTENPQQRDQLRDLATLLRRRKQKLKQPLKEKISASLLLTAFPVWACTSRSLCEILPETPGLFDLVVIDEASQCDLALAAVALLRAKRVVIVGDPHQLRRVCFLSRAREQASLARCRVPEIYQQRFSYRKSLYDVAADVAEPEHFFFLDEHFRSHPRIIEFSNREFYDCDLKIMTRTPSSHLTPVIHVHPVDGRRDPDSSVNETEIAVILRMIQQVVASSSANQYRSIGVVSPFRDQVDAIRNGMVREFSAEEISRHAMVVGTAHTFQGDEKDLVFFSTSIDRDSHPASLRFLESPNLFNVAITRARHEINIVCSVTADQLPAGLLRKYLTYAAEKSIPSPATKQVQNEWEQKVVQHLAAKHLKAWPGFEVAGQRIDVATQIEGHSVAILFDHGKSRTVPEWQLLENHRRLVRAGWKVVRLADRILQQADAAWMNEILKLGSPTELERTPVEATS